jgi:Na+-translocating ferredoxin:NAD+ oxidoreductase RnfC subunit
MTGLEGIALRGVVGAGGAGFPTAVKLDSKPEYVIVNAAECEPLLHKDIAILENFAPEVLAGLTAAMKLTNARAGIIAIKRKHSSVIGRLTAVLPFGTAVVELEDFYPAGDEFTLVHSVTGRVIQPGELPISRGCVVLNVETLLNIGRQDPVTEKFLTVSGAVRDPATVSVPIGTSYGDILSKFAVEDAEFRIFTGGLMMGCLEPEKGQLERTVTKTTGGIIVLPRDHPRVLAKERFGRPGMTARVAKASCDQCSYCTELCPRYLLGHPVRPELAMRNRLMSGSAEDTAFHQGNQYCCECNLCTAYSCPEDLDPAGATLAEKRKARQAGGRPAAAAGHPFAEYRRTPVRKLMQRLDVLKYRNEGPLKDLGIKPESVTIPLKQHAGRPAEAVVMAGQKISRKELVASADGPVSANIHASISGVVRSVTDAAITITR